MQAQTTSLSKNYLNREQLNSNGARCTLFVTIAQNRFVMLAADTMHKEVMGLRVVETGLAKTSEASAKQLAEWMDTSELGVAEFHQRIFLIENSCYTILPEALFIAEKAESYLSLVHKVPVGQQVLFNRSNHNVCIFALPSLLLQNITHLYPGAAVSHSSGTYIESIFNSTPKSEKDLLHVNFHARFIDVVYLRNGILQFVNTFPFEADTDIVFFILSVAEQQKINHEKLAILLSGDVSQTDTIIALLKKYIPEVLLQTRPQEFTYPAAFREFQEQQYYQPIAALLCGL